MDKNPEDIDKSSEIAATDERTDDALQSDSNLKSGKDADPSGKVSQPLDPIEDSEEDLLLCMNSDNEPFEGSSDVKESAKKSAVGEKSEKYFSDIESSDNSQEYEPKSVEKDVAVIEKEVVELEKEKKEVEVESGEKPNESEKTIELELEPVESDEEEFDENLLVKKTEEAQITKDDSTAKETGTIEVLKKDDAAKEKKGAPTLEENTVIDVGEKDTEDKENSLKPEALDIPEQIGNSSEVTLIDKKCEEARVEKLQVKEDEPQIVESDPKQAADDLEEKEKDSDDCSPELGTGKGDKTQVPDVIDLEADEIQKDDKNETMELKKDVNESTNPIAKETMTEIDEETEKPEKDTEVKVLDTEVKVVDTEVKVLGTEPKVLDIPETSLEKLKELNDASPTEKFKEDKTEKSDDNVLQSTENVSKHPPESQSEEVSSASKELDSKSVEETKSPEFIGSLKKTPEAIASPAKELIAKETEANASPVKKLISKETEAIASPMGAPISKKTEAILKKKKAEEFDPKASHIELGDASISGKPESEKQGKVGYDTKEEGTTKTTLDKELVVPDEDEEADMKEEDKTKIMLDKELVVPEEDEEATVKSEQREKISESKEKLEDTSNSDKSALKESEKEEDKTVTLSDKEIDLVENVNELDLEAKQIEETAGTEEETKAIEEIVEDKVLESPPAPEESKEEAEAIETAVEKFEEKADLSPVENIPTPPADEPKATDDKDTPPHTAEDVALDDEGSHLREKLTTKVSELMKTIDTSSLQGLTSDDDESLLVIDTTHKDDNENEDNDVDTETEQTAATASNTDSSSDGSLEIFYHKECSNYDCSHGSKNFYRAPQFTLSYYKVSKKRYKPQFVCEDCYDQALHAYEEMCVVLKQKQPLYGANFKRQDFVEIIDSSDEEDTGSNADNCKDESTFPKESIEFLENELEGIIRNVMQNVDIQNQLSWTKQVLQQSLDRVKDESNYVSDQLQQLQKKADKMHNSLYQCPSIKIRQLTPLDLNSGRSYSPESESTIPAIGDIERPSIQLNETYYAVKNKAIASWVPCKVIEEVEDCTSQTKNLKHFKIKFLKSKYPMLKTLSAKHMAYFDPPRVRLPIGTRVIAYFDASSLSRGKEKMLIPSAFYPGIIAEPLKMSNKFRYLVFYDDGYFQYVSYKDVRLVCHASENVWDDVHHQSRDFIQNYLTQYAVNRPMVQTQKGQCMLVDYNGKWVYARVVDVDCSLVQMMFEGQSRSEWIYRGSTRLGPVYKESNNIAPKTSWNQSRISRRTEPFIRYFNDEDSSSSQPHSQSQQHQSKSVEVRSVAKKSVSRTDPASGSQPVPVVKHLNNSTIFVDDDNKPKGKVVYYTARKNLPPRDFVPHTCGTSCPFVITHNLQFYSPLAKPLLSGWERQVFRQKSKKFIVYRGPCGKRLRSMEELHRYLRVTKNELNVDNFDFSSETNCLAEYVIESCIVQKKDISNGEEKMPIPCVNYYDNTMPPDCKYSSRRIPTEGVHLNLDPNFLVGCDCEDDCSDKSKCSCWQLTYAGAKYSMPNVPNEMVGYQFKRLYAHVPTGIYECNSRCKCKANCVNRVVQQSLQSKLQVFKTSNRGWGLRCINDVPRGSFICIYAGHLLTEQKANEGGLDAGDEYFAELDYIEVAEQIKEGYESDVVEADEEEEMYNPDKDDDDDEFIAPGDPHRNKSISTRLSTRRSTKNSSDAEHDSQERQVISFEPNKSQERPSSATERPTMRRLFGKDEGTYIMDAKVTGNLGRYFNHSCSPNLFVQNVFVDTHDLRFPWVAFFAFSHIRAGTELTWNYNYEVGVVPGKVLYCQCGAPNCRQRLL